MKYFKIYEFVPPAVYRVRGEKSAELIDDRLLLTADALRGRYGPAVINDWYWGGTSWASGDIRFYSGIRPPHSLYYSEYSQHSFGRAMDMLFRDVTVDEVREDIIAAPGLFPHIHGIELEVHWLHVDCRNYSGLLQF